MLHFFLLAGNAEHEHNMRVVMATYAWKNVEEHMHMLPTVADIPPSEWVDVLPMNERAVLAVAFANLTEAAKHVRHIDTDKPDSSIKGKDAKAVVNYIEARKNVEVVASKVAKWILNVLASSFPFDPGGVTSQKSFLHLHCSSLSTLPSNAIRRRVRGRKVVDIEAGGI